MEGELGFLSPARPYRASSADADGRGFGSPTWASPLETLLDSPASRISDGRSGFSSPTWSSPLETLLDSPSSCASNGRVGRNGGSGFSSPTWASPLKSLLKSPSSCVSDGRVGGNGSSGFISPPKTLLNSPSSCVSNSSGGNGSGFSSPTWGSPLERLFNSPSSCVSDSRGGGNSFSLRVSKERESEVQEAERLLRAITERYDDCFLRLRDATAELAELRRERIRLGAENLHLSFLLEGLEVEQSKQASAVALTPLPKPAQAEAAPACAPKSISIRSKGYLSQKQPQGELKPQRLRVRASPVMEEAGEKDKGDGEVEVEAYRQGATKTELCNKWERGACPFGGRCRFAHDVQELRPVIRHPRYKTLPCQMFVAASGCPYGHRCHFRHSLPPTAESC
ncbi:hypothetical protein ACP70R_014006 [Stipagrostis hirtigluma subsp. patula]